MFEAKVIYQADFTNDTDDTYKYYLELAETSFKDGYNNHKSSFRNEHKITKTAKIALDCLNTFGH